MIKTSKLLNSTLKLGLAVMLLIAVTTPGAFADTKASENPKIVINGPISLKTMGSVAFGGTVTYKENGESFHGDHGYAQYYIPESSRTYPLVMWHGIGQSGKSWESTPDGREGFQAILPRNDWPVYIIDQPRRGRAGYTQAENPKPTIPTLLMESSVWDAFRNGIWVPPNDPTFFEVVQFPKTAAAIDQFFRQQTPDTGEEPRNQTYRTLMGQTMASLFHMTGPGILVTHSNSGQYGWNTAMAAPELVKAIVAFEPGACVFPEGERPAEIPSLAEGVAQGQAPQMVPLEDFKKLTQMPILIIYGDNIGTEPSEIFNVDVWRVASARAQQFVDAVNRHGGDACLILLPKLGIKGNTHAPFADLNNIEIAQIMVDFLHSKGLDGYDNPHVGPKLTVTEKTIPINLDN